MYLDASIDYLPKHKLSTKNPDQSLLVLYYADDIVIAGPHHKCQNTILALEKYARAWDITFAPSKSISISQYPIVLNNEAIRQTNQAMYLGILIDSTGISPSHFRQACATLYSSSYQIQRAIPLHKLTLLQRCQVYKTFVRSRMEHGIQLGALMRYSNQQIALIHKKILVDILKLPQNANPYAAHICLAIEKPTDRMVALAMILDWKVHLDKHLGHIFDKALATIYNKTNAQDLLQQLETLSRTNLQRREKTEILPDTAKRLLKYANKLSSANKLSKKWHAFASLKLTPTQTLKYLGERNVIHIITKPMGEHAQSILQKWTRRASDKV